ncbi:DUF4365 domain-containing protein [Azospirillum himalayense]|uniref:DUF4365 domain-containing protein n=1 Tax=Azospirillum himalayense TaxID=654847 RepID=A0ABW0G270_9PROT
MITKQHTQECLSRAFIHAVAGRAGVNFNLGSAFDYGFDGQFRPVKIRNGRRNDSGFPLDFQLKATTDWEHDGGFVVYDLEAKTYNDLVGREPAEIGAVLILLCLPKDEAEWLVFQEDRLELRRCCYWERLVGAPTDNVETKRIRIPRTNLLTVESLNAILDHERFRRLGL